MTKTTTFNLLNPEDIEDFVAGLCVWVADKPAIEDWFYGIFKNWLRQQPFMMKRVVKRSDLNSPWLDILEALYADLAPNNDAGARAVIVRTVHIVSEEELPEWALRDLAVNKPVHFFDRTRAVSGGLGDKEAKWKHYADFMLQELKHKKVFKYSVEDMEKEVAAWDKRLARKKIIGEMSDGVIVIESAIFEASEFVLVRLDKRRSYENEGAAMRHCVKDYFGKENTHIYSVRSAKTGKPVMTVEHNTHLDYFLQKRGPTNATPNPEVVALFDAWADTEGKIGRGKEPKPFVRRVRRPLDEVYDEDWDVGRVARGPQGPAGYRFPEIGGADEDEMLRARLRTQPQAFPDHPGLSTLEAATRAAQDDVRNAAKTEQERLLKQREREDKTMEALNAVTERRARRRRI